MISGDILDRELSSDSLKVLTDGADFCIVEVTVLNLRNLALANADALGKFSLRQTTRLTKLTQAVRTNFTEHPVFMSVYAFTVDGALLKKLFTCQGH